MAGHLRIANLKKSYHITRTEKQEVLKGIDVEFNRGEFVAILGESGCGKSTLLNIMAGLDFDYTGSLVLNGNFMRDFSEKQLDDYRKKEVGIVFQSFNLIKHMTVLENITIAMAMSDIPEKERLSRANELIELVGLKGHEKKYPNQLSGGQKQKTAIARALANNPSMVLADEPTGNLDKENTEEILAILRQIAVSGKIVICVTHSQRVANECTRILRLDDGVIVSDENIKQYNTAKSSKEKVIQPKSIKTKEILKFAFRNVKQNFKRSILVSIALSIGIASFVLMFSISQGIRNYITNDLATSINRLQIDVTRDSTATGTFSSSDIKTIKELTGVDKVIESCTVNLKAEYKLTTGSNFSVLLTLDSVFEGFSARIQEGNGNLPKANDEILISAAMARGLGGSASFSNLLGKEIDVRIDTTVKTLKICGITHDNSAFAMAYISPEALASFYSGNRAPVNKLYVLAKDVTYLSAVVTDINALGHNAFRQDSSIEELLGYVDIGTFVLAGVSAVSLVVSAIMIFIVMYISVVERLKEIGILRAIGARKKDVRKLFIFEAAILGLVAGTIGCAFSLIVGIVTNLSAGTAFVHNSILYILMGLLISVGVSVVSALAPAANAANSDPIESLRAE